MPYIKQELRDKVDETIYNLGKVINKPEIGLSKAGVLNYTITKLICEAYGPIEELGYNDFNEIIGVLESSKLEFYRMMVVPYEEVKMKENGAVYLGNNLCKELDKDC